MEGSDYAISRYCQFKDRRILLNGEQLIEEETGADLSSFLSSVYKTFGSEYPKFYKMDLLSKLGLLTADFLVDAGKSLEQYAGDKVAVVVSNANSSLKTDARYYETIADKTKYYPSPALFVYTLPNILIGEICIKFKIQGESNFFVSQFVDFKNLFTQSLNLLQTRETDALITGWVDFNAQQQCDSILYFIEKKDRAHQGAETWPFTPESMEELFFEKNHKEREI